MKQILSMFVALMLVLTTVPMLFAQETTATEITGEVIVAEPVVTTAIQVGKEYSTLDSVLDRIRLAFTFQVQRKVELINKIEQKREQHYSFLVAKGKTEQAEKFKSKTIGLVKNFEQWKEKKAAKMEGKVAKAEEKGENATDSDKLDNSAENETKSE